MIKNCSCGLAEFYSDSELAEAFSMSSIHWDKNSGSDAFL